MSKFSTKIRKTSLAYKEGYCVAITIGVQTFQMMVCETEESAIWYQKMIEKALNNLANNIEL